VTGRGPSPVAIAPVLGIPEVSEGDDVAALVVEHAPELRDGDVVVVAHKVVSKAEGATRAGGDKLAVALGESARVLRRSGDTIISETRHGLVCANAGVDASNVPGDRLVTLPVDPDASARRMRARIARATGAEVAVIVSDTFGRAWRLGQTNVAIGVAGMDPFLDLRGERDASGEELTATRICVADEIASAAELVMGKSDGVPAAIVRGVRVRRGRGAARAIARPPEEDLFR
jgi:coenzyme F420-0:L-glutamate ligase/coenzyme F420-1:gamma-L-glutamate ligase